MWCSPTCISLSLSYFFLKNPVSSHLTRCGLSFKIVCFVHMLVYPLALVELVLLQAVPQHGLDKSRAIGIRNLNVTYQFIKIDLVNRRARKILMSLFSQFAIIPLIRISGLLASQLLLMLEFPCHSDWLWLLCSSFSFLSQPFILFLFRGMTKDTSSSASVFLWNYFVEIMCLTVKFYLISFSWLTGLYLYSWSAKLLSSFMFLFLRQLLYYLLMYQ